MVANDSSTVVTEMESEASKEVPAAVADLPPEHLAFMNEAHGMLTVSHGGRGQTDLRSHLTEVRYDLKYKLQCPDTELHAAALFHSIYGTEGFQGKVLPLAKRGDLQSLIGTRAEFLAYVNCVMERASFDAAVAELRRRRCLRKEDQSVEESALKVASRPEIGVDANELSEQQLEDLMKVHFADWQQNVELCNFYSYRRQKIAAIAAALGGRFAEVYADRMSQEDETKKKEVPEMVRARNLGVFDKVMSGEVSYAQVYELDDSVVPEAKRTKIAA